MGLMRMAVAALLALGCTNPRTELLILTTTDLAIPSEADAFEIQVTSPGGDVRDAVAHLGPGELQPPRVLGLLHDGNRLGPYALRIRATLRGAPIVERLVEVDFESGRTRVLRVHLTRDCVGIECTGETCAMGTCREIRVTTDELEPYGGQLPGADAAPPPDTGLPAGDAGDCAAEQCNGADDDCDGAIDETFDLTMDVANCGACGRGCSVAGGTAACAAGECAIGACDAGHDDCDGDPANGCEADLTAPTSCGACSTRCRPPTRDCCDGACC